jgi:hypothetical protein
MKILVLISFASYLLLSTFPNWGNSIEIDINESIGVASKHVDFDNDGKVETTKDQDQNDSLQSRPKPDLSVVLNTNNFTLFTTLLKVIFFKTPLLPLLDYQQAIEIPPISSLY